MYSHRSVSVLGVLLYGIENDFFIRANNGLYDGKMVIREMKNSGKKSTGKKHKVAVASSIHPIRHEVNRRTCVYLLLVPVVQNLYRPSAYRQKKTNTKSVHAIDTLFPKQSGFLCFFFLLKRKKRRLFGRIGVFDIYTVFTATASNGPSQTC